MQSTASVIPRAFVRALRALRRRFRPITKHLHIKRPKTAI